MMKRNGLLILLCGMLVFLAACSPEAGVPASTSTYQRETAAATSAVKPEVYTKITAEHAKAIMDKGGGVTVVDVRTEEEYREGHIKNAILVPNETLNSGKRPENLPDLDAILLVYCRTGVRSREASQKLEELGYKHIYDFGGITDWPYDTVTGEE